ncbi:hypothetical protein Tco_0011980 [Tanacetum coccineum]
MLTSDNSDDNKGVSSKGPSITSIPKEGPSIARRSKEPILKELLEWYGYDIVEDYLPVAKKPIPEVIFKSPILIKGCVLGLANVETWDNINHLVEIQADDHDLLVNSDNENDDMLGYESEKYSDDEDADGTNHAEDADGTNHSDLKLVKRGITRLYKFHREYGKPGGIKIKVTFDALNRVSGLHKALFLSFLGDLVHEHIGLKILSWKKVDKESRDKLWDEITRYFDVDLTVRKLVMHRLGKLLRNFRMKLREKYILPNLNTPSKLNELPAKYSAIVKAEEWVEFVNYTTTDAYKKEADDKIKEGTLNLDDGTDAMTDVFGKKRSYARGVTTPMALIRWTESSQSVDCTNDKDARIQKKVVSLHGKESSCLDEEVTPPTTIQKISDYNSAPKLQSKRKNYVSRETMQRQARTGKSHKSLNYGS